MYVIDVSILDTLAGQCLKVFTRYPATGKAAADGTGPGGLFG